MIRTLFESYRRFVWATILSGDAGVVSGVSSSRSALSGSEGKGWFVAQVVSLIVLLLVALSAAQPATRTVYVSVTDKNGGAVTDLRAADVEVKVGGKTQAVVDVRRATEQLRIAVLVADGGTGAFQLALSHFLRDLHDHAEFALVSVIVQPEKVVEYSTDAGALNAGLRRLGPRGRQSGAHLMEAIVSAAEEIRVEAKRSVIVVLRVGGERPTELAGHEVLEQLRNSGAVLFVVSTMGAERRAPTQIRGSDPVSIQIGQLRDSELADSALNLAQVLGDGATESGGRHDQVISTTMVPALAQVADELLHQYAINYTVPDSIKPNTKISVSSKRKGVTVRAPSRLP
jgi:VWFA-related protein